MARATWNGAILAESERTEVVEGNHYFPPEALQRQYFQPSDTQTVCSWKGTASYYHLSVHGQRNEDAAWYYPHPSPEAQHFAGWVAFWKGVNVQA